MNSHFRQISSNVRSIYFFTTLSISRSIAKIQTDAYQVSFKQNAAFCGKKMQIIEYHWTLNGSKNPKRPG